MVDAVRFPVFLSMLRGNIGNGWDVVLVLSSGEPGALLPLVGEKESVEVSALSGGAVAESDNITAYQGRWRRVDYAAEGLALPEVVNERISVERYGYSIICLRVFWYYGRKPKVVISFAEVWTRSMAVCVFVRFIHKGKLREDSHLL
ncbi:uncharacterized protein ARMOST_20439 [Armillaria ostoyae]|uniref:Uncharacterized protein n=1 Tax=Armillaria ostoyae TaxID=47428 RepID=A0A284S7C0_ARMOS|nr:uncharacterized protein ARMOST_20439 [Armillaria ostoyae]